MKKILQYSSILSVAAMLGGSVALADTGGYVHIKGMSSHWHALGFGQAQCKQGAGSQSSDECKFANPMCDRALAGNNNNAVDPTVRKNLLRWQKADGIGAIAGADYGFFRLEIEGTYQDAKADQWRGYSASGGDVQQARIFGNVLVEPFDLLELLGEYGGIEPLVKYNPAHYGISPYALYGHGIMGGLVDNLTYTTDAGTNGATREEGNYAGGATVAVNVGFGLNIGLDKLAKGLSDATGTSGPEYFKLPVEFRIGYHWQVGLDELLFDSMDEDLGIDDGGLTYSVGLKW